MIKPLGESPHEPKTFTVEAFDRYRKVTRREQFLRQVDTVMPWRELCEVVEPFYIKPVAVGRPPKELQMMLRIHFLQHWFTLSWTGQERDWLFVASGLVNMHMTRRHLLRLARA